jgi:hypothetical protein
MGICAGNETSGTGFGFGNRFGRGQRRGFGGRGGRGIRFGQQGWAQNVVQQNASDEQVIENEMNTLNTRLEGLKNQLQQIRKKNED